MAKVEAFQTLPYAFYRIISFGAVPHQSILHKVLCNIHQVFRIFVILIRDITDF